MGGVEGLFELGEVGVADVGDGPIVEAVALPVAQVIAPVTWMVHSVGTPPAIADPLALV